MTVTEYRVGDVKCIDDGRTRGVIIGCDGGNLVSLVLDGSIPHKLADELARTLEKLKLSQVVVQKGW
jgi:hypothetical protein